MATTMGSREEASQSEARFQGADLWLGSLIRNNPLATVLVDTAYRVQVCNAAFEALFGYREAEVVGESIDELIGAAPECRHEALEFNRRASDGNPVRATTRRQKKDGSLVDVEVTVVPLAIGGTSVGAYGIYRDLTGEKRTGRHLSAQYAVVQALAQSETLEEAAPLILAAVGEQLGFQVGVVFIADDTSGRLRCVDVWRSDGVEAMEFEAATRQTTFAPGEGFAGRIWATRRPGWTVDVATDRGFPGAAIAARAGLHAAFGFPIVAEGSAAGVIEFFSTAILEADEEILDMFVAVGHQLGAFVERKRAHRAAEEQMHEALKMKSDFVSFVTHQLRTPLSGIKWMLELAGEAEDTKETRSYIQDASESADRLIALVNDLLDVSRLESGKLEVVLQPVDVCEMTASVLNDVATLVREKGHALSVHATAVRKVTADPQLLRQVVLNLISNAIKYTPAGGQIDARIFEQDGMLTWSIHDSGIGIPQAAQAKLFQKFYRAQNAMTVDTEGTGLGLYLVRLIVERLGGQVACESQEGLGTTFSMTLPLVENQL